jgi:hypothetical protein
VVETGAGSPVGGAARARVTRLYRLFRRCGAAAAGWRRGDAPQPQLGHSRVSVRPVPDLAGQMPVDAYEVPHAMREALRMARPSSVFPWTHTSAPDIDHTRPYLPRHLGGPPGQTAIGNLGPPVPLRPSRQDSRTRLGGPTTHARHLPVAHAPQLLVSRRRRRHPSLRSRPAPVVVAPPSTGWLARPGRRQHRHVTRHRAPDRRAREPDRPPSP